MTEFSKMTKQKKVQHFGTGRTHNANSPSKKTGFYGFLAAALVSTFLVAVVVDDTELYPHSPKNNNTLNNGSPSSYTDTLFGTSLD